MDISAHIGELLYDHDCVIIPGFGGFVCSYQSAVIDSGKHLIYPPGKAISFNRYLQSNDGLLVNHVASKRGIGFYEASETINAWANLSNTLLAKNEEIVLNNIGRFFNDAELNLQFEPGTMANYLKSSYGLRPLFASPIIRSREVHDGRARRLQPGFNRHLTLRIAASALILTSMVLFADMMRMDVHIKSLELNQAGVASFVNRLFHTDEKRMEPIPIPAQTSIQPIDSNAMGFDHEPKTSQVGIKARPETSTIGINTLDTKAGYYIIIGAFRDQQNAEGLRTKLLLDHTANNILFEKQGSLTKVGYFAATDFSAARQQLISAQSEDSSYWMMKK